MVLSQQKEQKIIAQALLTKENADRFWEKTLRLYIEDKVGMDVLISAMDLSNTIDKEIIKKYGMEVFLSAYREKGVA